MEGLIVRTMRREEAARVAEITSASPEAARWTAADYLGFSGGEQSEGAQWNGTGKCVLVAVVGEQAIGFAALQAAAGELEVLNLAVDRSMRLNGVGSALLLTAFRAAKQAGARAAFCEVRESNIGAQAFYAKHGFARAGRRLRYYVNPVEDALVLGRGL